MQCSVNVLIESESGETSWQPLHRKDKAGVYDCDPVTVTIYARENNLLDAKGWKLPGLKKLAKTQKCILRHAKQAKLHSFRAKPICMYGFEVPRNHEQAMAIDRRNGNPKFADAENAKIFMIDEFSTFEDIGFGGNPGPDYKKIQVHMVYAVKHDGRHKARPVAGGHLTETPIDSVYSSVVSLRGIRLLTFVAELNDLEVWATDIGNAYLEPYTQEKVYIVAEPEFGNRQGRTLVIRKAFYGLKSSGLRWHERLSDVLRDMGFIPSKAERDIWMRDCRDHYKYIAVCVDDLLIASKDPSSIIKTLSEEHKFKLKSTGAVSFQLGCDWFRDDDGNLCYAPHQYIEKVMDNCLCLFGKCPHNAHSPLVQGDHPELDTSELLDDAGIQIYQSLNRSLQWAIQIGWFDIATAVMTLSRFRACSCQGHLDRVKRVIGYLSKFKHSVIRIRTDKPDYSNIPKKEFDWFYTLHLLRRCP